MLKNEIAEIMLKDNTTATWAKKVKHNIELSNEENEITQVVDAWAKDIGYGRTSAYELSQFLAKSVQPEVYNAPSEILSQMFDEDGLGEFDDYKADIAPKNTLDAIEAGKNGSVDKSFIDYKALRPTWTHLQIETEVSMEKLRKGGYLAVADITALASEAFLNKKFSKVFSVVDQAIIGGERAIVSNGSLVKTALDDATRYLLDRDGNAVLLGLSEILYPVTEISGFQPFLSQNMLDQINENGLLGKYKGVKLVPISSGKRMGSGEKLLPTNKLIGIAGKIGSLTNRGEMRVLQTPDNKREVIELKFTGVEFGTAIYDIDKINKVTITK